MRKYLVCILMLLPLAAMADPIERSKHLEMPIKDVKILQITCAAGFLELYGVDGAGRINVTATIKISGINRNEVADFTARHVQLSLKKRSHKAILESVFKDQNRMKADAKIDLIVSIPKHLAVQIDDGSGYILVSDLDADLKIVDGSGSISIRDIQGNVTVEDGSGKLHIADIKGNLEVKDGSGSMLVDQIKGNARLIDSSGQMTIKDIDGNLTIRDGSGGIEIINVTQNVLIKEAGSGNLEIDGVKGKVINWESENQ
ncbi:MAG: hypothetical protein R3274_05780 [Desulfobacterales bacterium]|nr:hypothetical protein [Desulfobacterales bacterium]